MKYKLVPLEPTPEMEAAYKNGDGTHVGLYRAMIEAAPAAPVELEPVKLKPAGYTLISDGVRVGLYAFKQDAMEKGMEIGARFDLLPLYHALPPDAAAVIAAKDAEIAGLKATERDYWALNVVLLKEQLAATEKERDKLIQAGADHVTTRDDVSDDETSLKPCPCCGSNAYFDMVEDGGLIDGRAGGWFIECANEECRLTTQLMFATGDDPRPHLLDIWNKRHNA